MLFGRVSGILFNPEGTPEEALELTSPKRRQVEFAALLFSKSHFRISDT
jgi:hypothetical protein